MTTAFIPGFLLGLGLILAIGAQNAFVLRQGLRGEHVLAICLACAVSDAVLISAGVSGFGALTASLPWLETALRFAGAAFLVAYGVRAFVSALGKGGTLVPSSQAPTSLAAALAACLAFTWLNPHVYLDTILLLGSISTQYPGEEAVFAAGAVAASFCFFFSLGYGARLLRPLFAQPGAWRVLDLIIGATMCVIALRLLVRQ
ncbi:LysE/ArgO family amino acid transporter [Devosia nitrariae]|uniref:Amino acid transporter n=1 Tax=Devosia nitrariae TaxID=2071872 RepID=A0ABQ5W6S4_9HYPH|nr:LysE/ArgO family amino acid transporter [Devosia nitrariae]GLQ55519.1 amino acid transporter [Devosia nitrariae]